MPETAIAIDMTQNTYSGLRVAKGGPRIRKDGARTDFQGTLSGYLQSCRKLPAPLGLAPHADSEADLARRRFHYGLGVASGAQNANLVPICGLGGR